MSPVVIAYYSRTGKTRFVAEKLAALLNADLDEIKENADRSGPMGYLFAGRDAMKKRESELVSTHTAEGRKVVILGMPVWAWTTVPAIRSYLKQVNLAGIKVCAYATMEGSGGEKALDATAALVPGGLAARLALKKPKSNPDLDATLNNWVEEIKKL